MPTVTFQASFVDPATNILGINLSTDLLSVVVKDNSNYATGTGTGQNDEVGHNPISKFSEYRKITVKTPSNNIVTLTTAPASGGAVTFNYLIADVDGVYEFNIITVPAWVSPTTYLSGHYVSHVDPADNVLKIWLFNAAVAGDQPGVASTWTLVTDLTTISNKYNVSNKVVVVTNLDNNAPQKIFDVVCDRSHNTLCTSAELVKDEDFMDALMLMMIQDLLPNRVAANDFESASIMLNYANMIGGC